MEPQISLLCSQEPAIGPYLDADESSPVYTSPPYFPQIRSISYLLLQFYDKLHSSYILKHSSGIFIQYTITRMKFGLSCYTTQ